MDENKIEDQQPTDEAPADEAATDTPDAGSDSTESNGDGQETPPEGGDQAKTFDAEYVGKLRDEAAGHRSKLRDREQAMHRLLVEQTGRLADPADLAFDAAHLDDPEALGAAIDALLEAKPHLRARQFGGVEQGPTGKPTAEVDLLGTLRGML